MEVKKDKFINVTKDQLLEEGCFRPSDKANPSCPKCYGTGFCGENLITKGLIICKCVMKALEKEENA